MDFFMLTFKSVGSLFILFLLTSSLGKKQINQLNMFDYVIGISIGNVVAEMTVNKEVNFFDGVLVMSIYAFISIIISFLTTKSIILRRKISGVPTTIIEKGKIIESGLVKSKLDINELLEEARIDGYFDISEIEYAFLETNGKISFLPKSKYKPITPNDIKLKTDYKGLCTNVIIDGKIMKNNLKSINKSEDWLISRLNNLKYNSISNLLLVTCDTNEKLTVYEKNINASKYGNFE
jgi:uncharacterized membrane protein YcaP (DUF421 family)